MFGNLDADDLKNRKPQCSQVGEEKLLTVRQLGHCLMIRPPPRASRWFTQRPESVQRCPRRGILFYCVIYPIPGSVELQVNLSYLFYLDRKSFDFPLERYLMILESLKEE